MKLALLYNANNILMTNRATGIVIEELGIVPIFREQLITALTEDLEEVS